MKQRRTYSVDEVEAALKKHEGDAVLASQELGCHHTTVYRCVHRNPERLGKYREAYDAEVRALADDGMRAILRNHDHPKHFDAVKLVKQSREPEYHPRSSIDHTTKGESVNREWVIQRPAPADDD